MTGAALALAVLAAVFAGACDGGDGPASTPSATITAPHTPAATSTPRPQPPLGDLIGPRAELPVADPIDLAARYRQTAGRAAASKPFAGEANVGEARDFAVVMITAANGPPPVPTTVRATLLSKTEHAYFYADDAIGVSSSAMQSSADAFEMQVWPRVTGVFGPPPSPGVDGDPRIIVLHADLGGVGGYVSSDDLYLDSVRPLSNEAEMIYMDSTIEAGTATFTVVLAHELQHLIHERNDPDEDAWVNEGLSETASALVGGALSSVDAFERRPETQLNRWDLGANLPHYGAGASFFRFLAARLGGDAVLGLIAAAAPDGPSGVEAVLPAEGPLAGSFARAFAEWATANVLDRRDGPYASPAPVDVAIERVLDPGGERESQAPQFGTDYYALEGLEDGGYSLRFEGAATTEVLPAERDVDGFWWGNAGDMIDTTLTGEVDLTSASAPRLTFRTWHEIERWYDRGYVSVSEDGGATWTALPTTTSTVEDPARMAYGPGLHGSSGDPLEPRWVNEEVDLSAYTGQRVLLRFEYVTDGGTHGQGWAVDDVTLWRGDAGMGVDLSSWVPEGWVRIDRPLAQRWIVRLVAERGGAPVVLDLSVGTGGRGELRFDATGLANAVLVVAGATEGTIQAAPYRVRLERP